MFLVVVGSLCCFYFWLLFGLFVVSIFGCALDLFVTVSYCLDLIVVFGCFDLFISGCDLDLFVVSISDRGLDLFVIVSCCLDLVIVAGCCLDLFAAVSFFYMLSHYRQRVVLNHLDSILHSNSSYQYLSLVCHDQADTHKCFLPLVVILRR